MNRLVVQLVIVFLLFNIATFAQDISGKWKVQKVEFHYWDLKEKRTEKRIEK